MLNMGRYIIKSAGLGNSSEIEIDSQIYDELKQSKACLIAQFQFEEKFDIILENYKDFESERFLISLDVELFSHKNAPYLYTRRRNLIRRIMNILTSIKLYLDVISSIEKEKKYYDDLKKYISFLYDESFDYRLMEGIRNHVQHKGSPFTTLQHSRRLDRKPGAFFRISTSVYLEVDELLNDKKIKAPLKKELLEIDRKLIEINKSISTYIGCIYKIHSYWRELNIQQHNKSEKIYLKYLEQYRKLNKLDSDYIYLSVSRYEADQIPEEHFEINDVLLENIEFLRNKNYGLDNLDMRFISSLSKLDGEEYFRK